MKKSIRRSFSIAMTLVYLLGFVLLPALGTDYYGGAGIAYASENTTMGGGDTNSGSSDDTGNSYDGGTNSGDDNGNGTDNSSGSDADSGDGEGTNNGNGEDTNNSDSNDINNGGECTCGECDVCTIGDVCNCGYCEDCNTNGLCTCGDCEVCNSDVVAVFEKAALLNEPIIKQRGAGTFRLKKMVNDEDIVSWLSNLELDENQISEILEDITFELYYSNIDGAKKGLATTCVIDSNNSMIISNEKVMDGWYLLCEDMGAIASTIFTQPEEGLRFYFYGSREYVIGNSNVFDYSSLYSIDNGYNYPGYRNLGYPGLNSDGDLFYIGVKNAETTYASFCANAGSKSFAGDNNNCSGYMVPKSFESIERTDNGGHSYETFVSALNYIYDTCGDLSAYKAMSSNRAITQTVVWVLLGAIDVNSDAFEATTLTEDEKAVVKSALYHGEAGYVGNARIVDLVYLTCPDHSAIGTFEFCQPQLVPIYGGQVSFVNTPKDKPNFAEIEINKVWENLEELGLDVDVANYLNTLLSFGEYRLGKKVVAPGTEINVMEILPEGTIELNGKDYIIEFVSVQINGEGTNEVNFVVESGEFYTITFNNKLVEVTTEADEYVTFTVEKVWQGDLAGFTPEELNEKLSFDGDFFGKVLGKGYEVISGTVINFKEVLLSWLSPDEKTQYTMLFVKVDITDEESSDVNDVNRSINKDTIITFYNELKVVVLGDTEDTNGTDDNETIEAINATEDQEEPNDPVTNNPGNNGSGGSSRGIVSTPVSQSADTVDIINAPTPLANVLGTPVIDEVIEVIDEEPPLASIALTTTEIADEEVPLAEMPQTGENNSLVSWIIGLFVSILLALALVSGIRKQYGLQ
ncbi:MAG: hypothetical protein FWD21_01350 [Peptococcaceae bacterium]|nr:hypothetical protein [Peptococcaceae bacterium]